MRSIYHLILLVFSLNFSACITMNLPFQETGRSPQILQPSGSHPDWILSYENRDPVSFGQKMRSPFLYTGEKKISELQKSKNSNSFENLSKMIYTLPTSPGSEGKNISVFQEFSEKIIVVYVSPDLSAKILEEEAKEQENRFDSKGNLQEPKPSPTRLRIQKEISSGKIPEGLEVIFLPSFLEPSPKEKARNFGLYCLLPITITLDIVSFPVQLVWFIGTGKAKYLFGVVK